MINQEIETEAERLQAQTEALIRATARRMAEAQAMPGLGGIRANRSLPIKSRRHSIPRLAIR